MEHNKITRHALRVSESSFMHYTKEKEDSFEPVDNLATPQPTPFSGDYTRNNDRAYVIPRFRTDQLIL